ncbi:hypothetical protein CWI39_3227p0010 [Hamiltosporidium magnivora]|uniref:Uncharacterized protein n=1 Tax=Hamiltosporidium magnivora TaxID=148818 RepID=A0A4Q9KQW2_9MICR|nr:hypothetical protein CWI39_3227p0010 [Hamiltosporidium magnivora]
MEKKKQKEVSEILSKLEFSIAYKIDYMKFSKVVAEFGFFAKFGFWIKSKHVIQDIYKFTNLLSHAFTNSFDKKMATYIFLQFLNDKELKTYNLSKNIGENKFLLK